MIKVAWASDNQTWGEGDDAASSSRILAACVVARLRLSRSGWLQHAQGLVLQAIQLIIAYPARDRGKPAAIGEDVRLLMACAAE
jgi:hypothetical protein